MNWRPNNWEKIKQKHHIVAIKNENSYIRDYHDDLIEAGADAILEVLLAEHIVICGDIHTTLDRAIVDKMIELRCKSCSLVLIPDK